MTESRTPAVVLTGSSTGIGRETALYLDRMGARVFAGVRREADGKALESEAEGPLGALILDVTDARSIEHAVSEVTEALAGNSLLGVVNNAGIALAAPLEFVDLSALRSQFETNVFGAAAVTSAFLPLLHRPGGRIVNVSSGAGKVATPLFGGYSASKFALEALSDALRVEVRNQGIAVSVIEPGFIETPMHEKNETRIDKMLAALPAAAHAKYDRSFERLREANERMAKNAAPPVEVAKAIHRALTSPKPKARYPVTLEAKFAVRAAPFLTDRLRDAIFGRMVGL